MAQLQIPITKAKASVMIDTDEIPEEVYQAALLEGLKLLVNTGKAIKAPQKGLEGEELVKAQAAALKQAEDNAAELHKKREVGKDDLGNPIYEYTGKVKLPGRKAAKSGISGATMTEARRIARNLVKDAIKREGGKISHYEASEITKAANELISADPSILAQAEKNLAERAKVATLAIDVTTLRPSDKLIAAAEAKKAKDKADKPPLSAAQAGRVAPRKGKATQANA